MKVLILLKFPYFGNGSGNYTRRLADHLSRKGVEVAIAAPDKREVPGAKTYTLKPPFRAVFEGHPEWRGAKRYSELTPMQFEKLYSGYLKQIIQVVEDFKPDVIHVNHASYFTWIASYIKSFYGISFITTLHGTDVYLSTIDRRFKVLTSQALDRAESLIAVAPHTKKWALKVFGRKLDRRIKIIPAGIEVANFTKVYDFTELNKKHKLAGKKLVLFVGRITKEKGVRYLVQAAKEINAEIFIVGEGPEKKQLENYAHLLGVGNVHFLGYFGKPQSKELRELYARADVVTLPSVVDEALGLVILEAMASRTPVVASNKGGIPLVVKNDKNGLLVRAKSAKALKNAINSILNNPAKAEQMSSNARKSVSERYDWGVLAPQVISLYEKAAVTTLKMQSYINKHKHIDQIDVKDIEREQLELERKIESIGLISDEIVT